jgi:trk system potassium uptake protein TrkA
MQNASSSAGRKTDVVILGCGRVGSRLAATMANEGYDVAVVDTDQLAFRRLPDNFRGRTVLGTGIDEDVLRRAGITQAKTFVAVSDNDNTNIMAAEIAQKVFNVPDVVARVYEIERARAFAQLGLKIVCPTATVVSLIREQVSLPSAGAVRTNGA